MERICIAEKVVVMKIGVMVVERGMMKHHLLGSRKWESVVSSFGRLLLISFACRSPKNHYFLSHKHKIYHKIQQDLLTRLLNELQNGDGKKKNQRHLPVQRRNQRWRWRRCVVPRHNTVQATQEYPECHYRRGWTLQSQLSWRSTGRRSTITTQVGTWWHSTGREIRDPDGRSRRPKILCRPGDRRSDLHAQHETTIYQRRWHDQKYRSLHSKQRRWCHSTRSADESSALLRLLGLLQDFCLRYSMSRRTNSNIQNCWSRWKRYVQKIMIHLLKSWNK